MPELKTAVEVGLRRLGWRVLNQDGPGYGQSPNGNAQGRILLAQGPGDQARFRLFVHCLDGAAPWVLYQRPAKCIARPEPLAGIIPLDISSCNLPLRSQIFVRRNARFTFHYADEGLEAESRRDLLPEIAAAAGELRRCFLRDYLNQLAGATTGQGDDIFYLHLLVTGVPLLTLHPDEAEGALASGDPVEMAWEAGFVPLYLPPCRFWPPWETAANREARQAETLRQRGLSFAFRLHYLLGQLPGIYWLISLGHLEESLRFILSYAGRWRSRPSM